MNDTAGGRGVAHAELVPDDTDGSIAESARRLNEECRSAIRKALDDRETYASLAGIIQQIASDYRDRAVFELIQNAHDAHRDDAEGEIFLRLVNAGDHGELIIANRGLGFTWDNVEAVRRPARSTKAFGEGIGNKGLGFRSVHILSARPEVYSCLGEGSPRSCFDGFCFRFANDAETRELVLLEGASGTVAHQMLKDMPRSLLTVPILSQPPEVVRFAQEGFASAVRIPLDDAEAVRLAEAQLRELLDDAAPPILFLDRIAKLTVETVPSNGSVQTRVVMRQSRPIADSIVVKDCKLQIVSAGGQEHLLVRKIAPRPELDAAIRRSLRFEERLASWLESQEDTWVSLALPLGKTEPKVGRVYCFLPLGSGAKSPVFGHIDAPFLVSLNRKELDQSFPLNAFFLDLLAATAIEAAVEIASAGPAEIGLSSSVVVDLVAWREDAADRLVKVRPDFDQLPIMPVVGDRWASFAKVYAWRDTGRYLSAAALADIADAPLLDPNLGSLRLAGIQSLCAASRVKSDLTPDGATVSKWVSSIAAKLATRRKPLVIWGAFLNEIVKVLGDNSVGLAGLGGSKIFLNRDGELISCQAQASQPVYLAGKSSDRAQRARTTAPPRVLKRRIRFVHEDVAMSPATKISLIKAGLATDYDPLAILSKMPSLIAKSPKTDTLRQILDWAFQIWIFFGEDSISAVTAAGLSVPTVNGWASADLAYFSGTWTDDGKRLEHVCRELAGKSTDMDAIADRFLTPFDTWPPRKAQSAEQWRKFLDVIGVQDGLHPLPCTDVTQGNASTFWRPLVGGWGAQKGLDKAWLDLVRETNFGFPNTEYSLEKGNQVWRLPGQGEHPKLSDEGALDYALLVLSYLQRSADAHVRFAILPRHRKERIELPTPLKVFLTEGAWLPVAGPDQLSQRQKPSGLWWRRSRAGKDVPRFLERPHEDVRAHLNELNWPTLVDELGLNDWVAKSSAGQRLRSLAAAVENGLTSDLERAPVKSAYADALNDALMDRQVFSALESVVASRNGEPVLVSRLDGEHGTVYVSDEVTSFETRFLIELGQNMIECDDAGTVAHCLRQAGFDAKAAENAEVEIKVDGQAFGPSDADPFLVDAAGRWLTDVADLCLEAEGRGLAKQIRRPQFRAAFNKVRIHFAAHIDVTVAGLSVMAHGETFLTFRDSETRTVISVGRTAIGWEDMTELGRALERLIDRRADGALRTGFTILAASMSGGGFARPTDEQLARVLKLPPSRVQDLSKSRSRDFLALAGTLAPILYCLAHPIIAETFSESLAEAADDFDAAGWLDRAGVSLPIPSEEVVDLCLRSEDRNTLRRTLEISLIDFNVALVALELPQLENRANLVGQFEFQILHLKAEILERLRSQHAADYVVGASMDDYVQRRSLTFISFDESWLTSREEITEDDVRARVDSLLVVSPSPASVELEPLAEVRSHNLKAMGRFIETAAPLVDAWCDQNGRQIPDGWQSGRPEMVRRIDGVGLLDFLPLSLDDAPITLRRAKLWPEGMGLSLDPAAHHISLKTLDDAAVQRETRRQQAELESRQIRYSGQDFDGANEADLENLAIAAREEMFANPQWTKRSGEGRLEMMQQRSESAPLGPLGRRKASEGRERAMTNAQKRAVGLLGEVRAFEWIKRKHRLSDEVAPHCWVSMNRREGLGMSGGDDDRGFDFEVILKSGRRYQFEVKASRNDPGEFELGSSEIRAASRASPDRKGHIQFRILYIPNVTDPEQWRVVELPNPMSPASRGYFQERGRGSLRLGFRTQKP